MHAPRQDDWYRRAELALTKGDEELAREALSRKKANQVGRLGQAGWASLGRAGRGEAGRNKGAPAACC